MAKYGMIEIGVHTYVCTYMVKYGMIEIGVSGLHWGVKEGIFVLFAFPVLTYNCNIH